MIVTLHSNDGVQEEIEMNKNDKGDNQIKLLDDILQLQDDSLMELMEPQDNDAKSCSSIPLPMVSGKELVSIAEFFRLCETLKKENSSEEVVKRQKSAFANKFDVDSLIALTIAANYINYDGLMDCTCERIANMIRGKNSDEIREMFNIDNDISPEEDRKISEDNQWIFA